MTRLRNSRGSDCANVNGVEYVKHSDGFFYIPADVAQSLIGRAGFYLANEDDHPEAGSATVEEVADVISALEPGELRDALISTLSAHRALHPLELIK